MQIIAHRALLRGPSKELENKPEQIDHVLKDQTTGTSYILEVDVWLINETEWFLGHDAPQYPISLEFLSDRRQRLICHAKNSEALQELIRLKSQEKQRSADTDARIGGWRFFFHDTDDYTLTSDGTAWVFPGKRLFDGSICVMPERAADAQKGFWECSGVCTDFAEQYAIYDEMRGRHKQKLNDGASLVIDEDIMKGRVDDRRCLAVYTMYNEYRFVPSAETFDVMQAELLDMFPQQCPYVPSLPAKNTLNSLSGVDQSANNHHGLGLLHFTFLQIFGFSEWEAPSSNQARFAQASDAYITIVSEELAPLLPFTIDYRGIIAFNAGLMLLGHPSKDLNGARERIQLRLEKEGLPHRVYTNNIVHSTLLRLCQPEDNQKLLNFSERWKDTYFGTLSVKAFDVGVSSWRMLPEELRKVGNVPSA